MYYVNNLKLILSYIRIFKWEQNKIGQKQKWGQKHQSYNTLKSTKALIIMWWYYHYLEIEIIMCSKLRLSALSTYIVFLWNIFLISKLFINVFKARYYCILGISDLLLVFCYKTQSFPLSISLQWMNFLYCTVTVTVLSNSYWPYIII